MSHLQQLVNAAPELRHNVARRAVQLLVSGVVIGLCLFIPAGSVNWPWAWYYLAIYLVTTIIGLFILPLEVIAERGSKKQNVEKWDRVLSLIMTAIMAGIYAVAGFDFRWGWSPDVSVGWHLAAGLACASGLALFVWAMQVNHFFSDSVRMQFDRGHTVCSSGPYRYVRHPGYIGYSLFFIATPVFLGTLWALIPAFVFVSLLVTRTGLEDKTLQQKLPGYAEYASRVRYRLLPWIW